MFSNNMYKELERLKAENELMRNHIESAETEFYVQLGALRVSLEQADKDRDILRAEIERLKSENEKLKAYAPDPFDDSLLTYAQLVKDLHETENELGSVRDMLLDVAHSGVEIEFRQYTTVQINRTMWDKIQEWAKGKEAT